MTGSEILLCLAIWSCVLLTLTTVKPLCATTDPKHHDFPSQSPIVGICRKFYNLPWFLTSCKQPWLTHGHLCLLHILCEELLGTAWNYAYHDLETACNKFSFKDVSRLLLAIEQVCVQACTTCALVTSGCIREINCVIHWIALSTFRTTGPRSWLRWRSTQLMLIEAKVRRVSSAYINV